MNEFQLVPIFRKWHTDLLRSNPHLAIDYLQTAPESLGSPEDSSCGLVALRFVADARGSLSALPEQSGIRRESLQRALSPRGNPTLKTLIAILKTMGLRLSVTPDHRAPSPTPPDASSDPQSISRVKE